MKSISQRLAIFLIFFVYSYQIRAASLTEADIIALLHAGVPPSEVSDAIAKNGYEGSKDSGALGKIRTAGGDVSLLLAIRNQQEVANHEPNPHPVDASRKLLHNGEGNHTKDAILSPKAKQSENRNPNEYDVKLKRLRVLYDATEKKLKKIDSFSFPKTLEEVIYIRNLEGMTLIWASKISANSKRNWYYVGPGDPKTGFIKIYDDDKKKFGFVDRTDEISVDLVLKEAEDYWGYGSGDSTRIVTLENNQKAVIYPSGTYAFDETFNWISRFDGNRSFLFLVDDSSTNLEIDPHDSSKSKLVKNGIDWATYIEIFAPLRSMSSCMQIACNSFNDIQKDPKTRIHNELDMNLFFLEEISSYLSNLSNLSKD